MTDDFPYSRSHARLESLLAGVKRPGDFCVHGALALTMPMDQVDGVGLLSFPLAQAQIAALIAAAERAPYGRGEQTVLDTSVRQAWRCAALRGAWSMPCRGWRPDRNAARLAGRCSGTGWT